MAVIRKFRLILLMLLKSVSFINWKSSSYLRLKIRGVARTFRNDWQINDDSGLNFLIKVIASIHKRIFINF